MSAYIVEPRTIDYLLAWAHRHNNRHMSPRTRRIFSKWVQVPIHLQHAVTGGEDFGYALDLIQVSSSDLGRILMAECVRSVETRYPNDTPATLPGPTAQHPDYGRIRAYTFKPIGPALRPDWVVKSCDCLSYQSCETDDWEQSLAYAILEAIREDAITEWTDEAPWGVIAEDLGERIEARAVAEAGAN